VLEYGALIRVKACCGYIELERSYNWLEGQNIASSSSLYNFTGQGVFTKMCRCGGQYVITDDDLASGVDLTCCDVCSLTIRVLYQQCQHSDNDIA